MSRESCRRAGLLFILIPTVVYGCRRLLSVLAGVPRYPQNQLRQALCPARHAHAGRLPVLSLVALRYVDEAGLSERLKRVVRAAIPAAAILLPLAFFLSVVSPDVTAPNAMIYLAYLGAASLAVGLLVLGVGLVRSGGPTTNDCDSLHVQRGHPEEPAPKEKS